MSDEQTEGELFFPSNSDHGFAFERAFCHRCAGWFSGYCRVSLHALANAGHKKWVKADNALGGECLSFKPKGYRKPYDSEREAGGQQCLI